MKKNKFQEMARLQAERDRRKQDLNDLVKKLQDKFPEFTPEELALMFPAVFK